jgi:hypothetical protein
MCCELDGGLLVGGQIAVEHHNVEIVLDLITRLSPMFGPTCRIPYDPMQRLLMGRKFQGFSTSSKSGDVSLLFDGYRIRFVRQNFMVVLDIELPRNVGLTRSN